jgi:hypothetical protein
LSRFAQAFDSLPGNVFLSASLKKAGLLIAMLALGGCGIGGFSLEKADIDRSIVTGSVPASSPSGDSNLIADQATIRDAVSSADVETLGSNELAWANSQTGSRGAIMQLAEDKTGGRLCRRFTTTRESFDGVALFEGKACVVGYGAWRIEGFKEAQESAAGARARTGISS